MRVLFTMVAVGAVLPLLAACQMQTMQQQDIDQDCAIRKGGSRLLSKAIGFGLGSAGVPAAGLAGRAAGYATKPDCSIIRPPKSSQDHAAIIAWRMPV